MGNTSSDAPARGFATIDFETTGLFAENTDRAIEVAVVHSDPDGTITGQFSPKPAVTKRIALVVAADPDSLSGKARKARDYGIPIVGEPWLEAFLGSQ